MIVYTALIYDGRKQHLVTQPCANDAAFSTYLMARFGVHVCLWQQKSTGKVKG
ncbi:hypothetical protein [Alteromonas sp. C1M14]|uniref:hypothetical protein n=1 Tax=Alteromonas sp. C1M14 TaxID=2841567 RepID=UPI001C08C99B|nr:hypothetical protein [Alteromonas sp. C1M14]MBU2977463.1 hypothetical protein [Alteromonas sp. C1M14]